MRRRLLVTLGIAASVAVAGCATSDVAPESSSTPSTTAPPPTSGTMPWGADLHGFSRIESRCIMDDLAVRMVWSNEHQFTICLRSDNSRYLRAWTTTEPTQLGADEPFAGMQGEFFTDTANSSQFVAGRAKFDMAPTLVTVVWETRPGTNQQFSSTLRNSGDWKRLDLGH